MSENESWAVSICPTCRAPKAKTSIGEFVQKNWAAIAIMLLIVFAFLAGLGLMIVSWEGGTEDYWQSGFGEYFGGVFGTLITAFSSLVLVTTLILQWSEIRANREASAKTAETQQKQNRALEELARSTEMQRAQNLTLELYRKWVKSDGRKTLQVVMQQFFPDLATRVTPYSSMDPKAKAKVLSQWRTGVNEFEAILNVWMANQLDEDLANSLMYADYALVFYPSIWGLELSEITAPDCTVIKATQELDRFKDLRDRMVYTKRPATASKHR